eukprot:scaffold4425_cov168-Amphora_coffeaeformis.AAC.11
MNVLFRSKVRCGQARIPFYQIGHDESKNFTTGALFELCPPYSTVLTNHSIQLYIAAPKTFGSDMFI